jgi:hypothetical protein
MAEAELVGYTSASWKSSYADATWRVAHTRLPIVLLPHELRAGSKLAQKRKASCTGSRKVVVTAYDVLCG